MLDRGLRWPTLAVVLAAMAALSWSFGRWWLAGGHPPLRVGWLAGVVLLGMGAVVLGMGRRMWRLRHGRTHVEPVVAARILGLAQASALTGAVIAGLHLGQAIALAPDAGFAGRGELALKWGLAGLGAVVLGVAGLLVQRWCRIDDDDGEDHSSRSGVS